MTEFQLTATKAMPAPIASAQHRRAASTLKRLRTVAIFAAPMTAPTPKAPSIRPYVGAPKEETARDERQESQDDGAG